MVTVPYIKHTLRQSMKRIIAIDSFKGCLTSREANEAAAKAFPNEEVITIPVSDGGEGMLDAFATALNAHRIKIRVKDPLMRTVDAEYAIKDNVAIIEVAQAIGLSLVDEAERNPLRETSYGAGQLIADAMRRGCNELIIGLGGTATSDCGIGMLKALTEIFSFGEDNKIFQDIAPIFEEHDVRITIASDVKNPLLGENGAARVYGKQKGADEKMIEQLEARAEKFARMSKEHYDFDCSNIPGAGAAGGLGYALLQYLHADIQSGAGLLLDYVGFDKLLEDADEVITGEGCADRQTLMGKLPYVILEHAKARNVACTLIAGKISDEAELKSSGFSRIININTDNAAGENPLDKNIAKKNITKVLKNLLSTDVSKQS